MTQLDRTGSAIARLFLCLGIAHNILRFSYGTPGAGNFFGYLVPFWTLVQGERPTPHDVIFLALPIVLVGISIALFLRDLKRPLNELQVRPIASATLASLATAVIGLGFIFVATVVSQSYGWALFCLVPVILGFVAVLIDAQSVTPSVGRALVLAVVANLVCLGGLQIWND